MRSTGGRRTGAPRSGTPTAAGFAALVTTLLLAGCSGEGPASARSGSAAEAGSDDASSGGIDPEAARLADLLRRLELSWADQATYSFRTRTTGTFAATGRGQGAFGARGLQQRSTWRTQGLRGADDFELAFNSVSGMLVGRGLRPDESRTYRKASPTAVARLDAVVGPGVGALPFWTGIINDAADSLTEVDLDPDGTGDKVAFTLPTASWIASEDLPPGVAGTTDYEVTFDGRRLVRIRASRDDSLIDVRIDYGPYRRLSLPAAAYRGL